MNAKIVAFPARHRPVRKTRPTPQWFDTHFSGSKMGDTKAEIVRVTLEKIQDLMVSQDPSLLQLPSPVLKMRVAEVAAFVLSTAAEQIINVAEADLYEERRRSR